MQKVTHPAPLTSNMCIKNVFMSENISILEDSQENYKKGYIKIFRSIEEHWISCNPYYYQAFNRLLFRVNHCKNTELIEGEIIECDRGQSIYSLNSWADIFNKKLSKRWWTIQKVRTFFSLMQKDNMIIVEGLRKTTRVTICNYDSYQNSQHRANTELTHSQHRANTQLTTTKDIKVIKDIKEDNITSLKFYESEIKNNKDSELINQYSRFVKILFGENDDNIELKNVLKIKNQLTYKQFSKIWKLKKEHNKSIGELVLKMENKPKSIKGNTSLNRTLQTWMKNSF